MEGMKESSGKTEQMTKKLNGDGEYISPQQ